VPVDEGVRDGHMGVLLRRLEVSVGKSWWCCMPMPLSANVSEVIALGITEFQLFVSIERKLI